MTFARISEPAMLEAMARREALSLATDLNLRKLCVASDCQEVINSLEEIKWRAEYFKTAHFRYESRSSNREAHSLARSVTSSPVWHMFGLWSHLMAFVFLQLLNYE